MSNPTTVAWYRGRWFEVYNASGGDVDLAGLTVSDGSSGSFTVSSSVTLAADDYALFAFRSSSSSNGGLPAVDVVFSHTALSLAASGELVLSYGSTLFDEVTYDTTGLSSGRALSLSGSVLGSSSNDSSANWCAAAVTYGSGDYGSPGAANASCGSVDLSALSAGDLIISEVMISPAAVVWYRGQWFEITNTTDTEVDLDGLTISDDDGDSITISGERVVGAGETVVLAMRDNASINGGLPRVDEVFSSTDLALGEVDGLSLSYGSVVFDSVLWDSEDYDVVEGASLMLDGDHLNADDNDDLAVWCAGGPAYGDGDYGSPGTRNEPCDADEDGYSVYEDCDDSRGDVSPGDTETCDGVDNDCDALVDEGLTGTYAPDLDGDTYGDRDSTVTTCITAAPSGWVTRVTDCNDADASIRPGAAETCDGIDTNCSGDESDAADAVRYYADKDYDFYGSSTQSVKACARPTQYRTNNLDCDDTDAANNPKGIEACDGEDNDCDGSVDEDFSLDASPWYTDSDGDGYGDTETMACEQPTDTLAIGGDCDDTDPFIYPGRLDIFDGDNPDCDDDADQMTLADAPLQFAAEATGDRLGYALAGAGDVNGDGAGDLWVGAYLSDAGTSDGGAVYLVLGPLSMSPEPIAIDTIAAATLTGAHASDYAGFSIAAAGDVDADGYEDVLVGAYQEDTGGASAGAAYLVWGPVSGTISLSSADATLTGGTAGDYAGRDVAGGGDLDGDGLPDLVLGAYHEDSAATGAGAVYVVSGTVSGALALKTDADATFRGESAYAYAGMSVDGAGDVDGDGHDDLVAGASLESSAAAYAGAVYLLHGPLSGTHSLSNADGRWTGEAARDEAGFAVAGAGDINNDGYADLLVGAPKNDTGASDAGAAYVLLGTASAVADAGLSDADAILTGEGEVGWFAATVSRAGDVNDDGYADVLLGAYRDDDAATDAGAVWLVAGPLSGTASISTVASKLLGVSASDAAGIGLGAGGDLSGDGVDDLLIGAYGASSAAGAAYVLWGVAE